MCFKHPFLYFPFLSQFLLDHFYITGSVKSYILLWKHQPHICFHLGPPGMRTQNLHRDFTKTSPSPSPHTCFVASHPVISSCEDLALVVFSNAIYGNDSLWVSGVQKRLLPLSWKSLAEYEILGQYFISWEICIYCSIIFSATMISKTSLISFFSYKRCNSLAAPRITSLFVKSMNFTVTHFGVTIVGR